MDKFVTTIPKKFIYETGDAYDTAWAARVPDLADEKKPAFPQALDWIRNHQLADGSWGSQVVNYRFDRILSTLNSVICLKQWYTKSDDPLIQRAINALNRCFAEPLKADEVLSLGFELILPKLLDDCKGYGIVFRSAFIDSIEKERAIKMATLKDKGLLRPINKNDPATWWFHAEAFENFGIKPDEFSNMICNDGTVCGCFSATAFVLTQNKQLTQTYTLLKNELARNDGCLPNMQPVESFDLAWSITHLYFADFDMNDKNLKIALQRLNELWTQFEWGVPGNIGLPIDCDTTAVTLSALVCSQHIQSISQKDIQKVLNFFDDNYFRTYEGEIHPSVSTNLNVIIAFNLLAKQQEFNDLIAVKKQKTIKWLLTQIKQGQLINDKWHVSPFYATSHLILAFTGNDDQLTLEFINLLLPMQHQDGGWGMTRSTLEESAYVVISLYHWIKSGNESQEILLALSRSKKFMNEESELHHLWTSKVLNLPINVVKGVVFSAIVALEKLNFKSELEYLIVNVNRLRQFKIPEFVSKFKSIKNELASTELQKQWIKEVFECSLLEPKMIRKLEELRVYCERAFPKSRQIERLENGYKLILMTFVLDDHSDERDSDQTGRDLIPTQHMWNQLSLGLDKLMAKQFISMSNWKPYNLMWYAIIETIFNKYKPFQKERLVKMFRHFYQAEIEETTQLVKPGGFATSNPDYLMEIRFTTIGIWLFSSVIEYCLDITVTDEEYDDPVMQNFIRSALRAIALVNDLYSFEKEYNKENRHLERILNAVAITALSNKLSIEEAIHNVLKQIIALEEESERLANQLVSDPKGSEMKKEFIENIKHFIGCNYYALTNSARYNQNV